MQPLFIDVSRLRKQALTSLKIILKPGNSTPSMCRTNVFISSGAPEITTN